METAKTLRISLNYSASKSFVADLKRNNIPFFENSPKVRMTIQLVKERFGSTCIKITEVENC